MVALFFLKSVLLVDSNGYDHVMDLTIPPENMSAVRNV
jgi:hypothetical protein